MTLKRIGVLSCGRVAAILYAVIGLIAGAFIALFSLFGAALGGGGRGMDGALLGAFFGAGAVLFMPIFYGVLGFLVGMLMAAIYNAIAHLTGGVEVELG